LNFGSFSAENNPMKIVESAPSQPSISRSLKPSLPANFISRPHLFVLFERNVPGVTVVVAPVGYGKTTLVSEWAEHTDRPTIWLSIDPRDSIQSFFEQIAFSIRRAIPDFQFNPDSHISKDPQVHMRELIDAARSVKQAINFVIDKGAIDNPAVSKFGQVLIDNLPENSHLVLIRRQTPEYSLNRYASLGNYSLITAEDLKFSESEVAAIAKINKVDFEDPKNRALIDKCDGWPAAVQLLTRSIARSQISKLEQMDMSDPLIALTQEVFNNLNQDEQSILTRLSLVQNFDLEIASIILGQDFSEADMNKLASDGIFLSVTTGSNRVFKLNKLTRQVISEMNNLKISDAAVIHSRLATYFLEKSQPTVAIEHLYLSKNFEKLQKVLKTSIREMAIAGRGDLVIQWADYISDPTAHIGVMRKTIKIVGHLVNSEFDVAEAMATELDYIAQQDKALGFLHQLTAMILAHVYFTRGQFKRSLVKIDEALSPENPFETIEVTDKIALLRVKASIHFFYDQHDEVIATFNQAKLLEPSEITINIPYHLTCISSMALWSEGRIFEAAEQANIAITQANTFGFSSISAPFDAYLVLAKCQSEMLQSELATTTLVELKKLSQSVQVWPWYFQASDNLLRLEISRGYIHQAVDVIKELQVKLSSFTFAHEMGWMVDSSEILLRSAINDISRLKDLMLRSPRIDLTREISMSFDDLLELNERKFSVGVLPEKTARDRVEKYVYQSILHYDNQTLALQNLANALEIGAEVGFNDFFVRQKNLYSILVKAAVAKPTVFRENLVKVMGQRISSKGDEQGSLGEKLTKREVEILKHLSTGVPISAISKKLHISQNTMKTHLRNLYRKLDVDGRHSAVDQARKLLLI
jgi:ATP/maltotriose-dependent transcriptional regulator MalT